MVKIIITKTDTGKVTTEANTDVLTFLQLLSTGTLAGMRTLINKTPEGEREELTKDLWDMYNYLASNVLLALDPSIERYPNLTEQAILEAENAILEKMEDA